MPLTKVSMSRRTAWPSLPARSRASVCVASWASVAALGWKFPPLRMRPIALTPGTSMAAARPL